MRLQSWCQRRAGVVADLTGFRVVANLAGCASAVCVSAANACVRSIAPPFPIEAPASMGSLFQTWPATDAKKEAAAFLQLLLCVSAVLSSRAVASQVLSPLMSLTSVFGMGTGGPSSLLVLTYGDPCGNRTHVWGVRGPRLNLLTNGPGTPSGTRTLDTLIKSQVLYQLS